MYSSRCQISYKLMSPCCTANCEFLYAGRENTVLVTKADNVRFGVLGGAVTMRMWRLTVLTIYQTTRNHILEDSYLSY
jgi:hypothetical protein